MFPLGDLRRVGPGAESHGPGLIRAQRGSHSSPVEITLSISTARDTCADLLWTLLCRGSLLSLWSWLCEMWGLQSVRPQCESWLHHLPDVWATLSPCACVCVSRSVVSFCDLMDCSPPGYSVHGILQARTLEWVVMPSSRGSSWPRDRTWVFCIAGGFFTVWVTREAPLRP